MESYYHILNIQTKAPIEEVKKAYRELAKKYHPDKNSKDQASVYNFLRINRAYEFLKEPTRKEKYDHELLCHQKKNNIHYDSGLIKEYISKNPRYKSKFIFSQKVKLKNHQCVKCEGYGKLLSRFSIPATCPQCGGTGKVKNGALN